MASLFEERALLDLVRGLKTLRGGSGAFLLISLSCGELDATCTPFPASSGCSGTGGVGGGEGVEGGEGVGGGEGVEGGDDLGVIEGVMGADSD